MMLFTVCNKLQLPVLVNFFIGAGSVVVVLLTLNFGNLGDAGVYVIAGVSSVLLSIRSITFVPLYSAHILGKKKSTFMMPVLRGVATFIILSVLFALARPILVLNSWTGFLISCVIIGVLGYIITLPLLFNKRELKKLTSKFIKK